MRKKKKKEHASLHWKRYRMRGKGGKGREIEFPNSSYGDSEKRPGYREELHQPILQLKKGKGETV